MSHDPSGTWQDGFPETNQEKEMSPERLFPQSISLTNSWWIPWHF